METARRTTGRTQLNTLSTLSTAAVFALCFTAFAPVLHAQETTKPEAAKPEATKPEAIKPESHSPRYVDIRPIETYYLAHASQVNDGQEILTELRLMLDPADKLYLVPSQNAIVLRADAADMALAKKLISEMDRPRKTWRLTYTIVESDGGKRVGVQHTSLVVVEGGRTTLKNGSKIPIATGSTDSANSHVNTQFTYVDVGLNIDASLDGVGAGARLRSKIEQSSAVESKSIAGVVEPVIRQNVTEGTAMLMPGKSITLGSLDITGSTRHLDIEVVMEPVP